MTQNQPNLLLAIQNGLVVSSGVETDHCIDQALQIARTFISRPCLVVFVMRLVFLPLIKSKHDHPDDWCLVGHRNVGCMAPCLQQWQDNDDEHTPRSG